MLGIFKALPLFSTMREMVRCDWLSGCIAFCREGRLAFFLEPNSSYIQRPWALSYTRCNAALGTTQVFFASFSPMQLLFSRLAPRCLNSKCICAHLCTHERSGLKTRCVQAHCWSVAVLRQLK